MSTPKISFRVSTAEPEGPSGDVITQDASTAPGKEREREPLYGGELANMGPEEEARQGENGIGAGAEGEGEAAGELQASSSLE